MQMIRGYYFQTSILEILQQESDEAQKQAQRDADYRQKVIAEAFDFDRMYSEWEVNITIADFYDDFCTIRRDMVSERMVQKRYDLLVDKRGLVQPSYFSAAGLRLSQTQYAADTTIVAPV